MIAETRPETEVLPWAFLQGAKNYYKSANLLKGAMSESGPLSNSPLYLLYSHAAELALKAFLLSKGLTTKQLRRRQGREKGDELSHNLENLYRESLASKLDPPLDMGLHFGVVLPLLHSGNNAMAFRYWNPDQTLTADLDWVKAIVDQLIKLVEARMTPTDVAPGKVLVAGIPLAIRATVIRKPENYGIPSGTEVKQGQVVQIDLVVAPQPIDIPSSVN